MRRQRLWTVHTRCSDIVTDVTGEVVQQSSSEEDLHCLKRVY